MSTSEPFVFEPHPEAANWVRGAVEQLLLGAPSAQQLKAALLAETGTRLEDWVERIQLIDSDEARDSLTRCGFVAVQKHLYEHPRALLPVVELAARGGLSLRVEDVEQVTQKRAVFSDILGEPSASTRAVRITPETETAVWATERHLGRLSDDGTPVAAGAVQRVLELFRERPRDDQAESELFSRTHEIVREASKLLPRAYVCDLFFRVEREYWESRNSAARLQKSRQDAFGFGWGNHDHHTYRSSRDSFSALVSLLEQLGLSCRERFYAGPEAGWGAQVMEHQDSGLMVFADVDLSTEELSYDFSHRGLTAAANVGTVGLWCALHGEAIFSAGMHHLEAQFDFTQARQQLGDAVGVMPAFTEFEYLKQCFTSAQLWQVSAVRSDRAVSAGWIDGEQAARFQSTGAFGSHLEILERNQGFKGFNQTGISDIITRTDPRRSSR